MKTIKLINGQPHTQCTTIWEPVEEPTRNQRLKCPQFRKGQSNRKAGQPCKSTNGAYLDSWYSPEQVVPPFVTQTQADAFKL